MAYVQLAENERYHIYHCLQNRVGVDTIARNLGRHVSTIRREIKRNSIEGGYFPPGAIKKMLARREGKNKPRIPNSIWKLVDGLIENEQFSPEQISGWLKTHFGVRISHEWIYQHVFTDHDNGGELVTHLRHYKKARYKKRYKKQPIAQRRSIETRPDIVDTRERLGDWEIDTMVGKSHQGLVLVARERKSHFTKACLLETKTEAETTPAILALLEPVKDKILTITSDNGGEFAGHETVSEYFGADYYFAHPYCSFERGSVENTNGLYRQYFPKETNFTQTSQDQLDLATEKLNRRPRKTLNWQTPNHVYNQNALAS